MAYSALVSLEKSTHLILNPQTYTISVYAEEKITSIREHAISLISLLENYPEKVNPLEAKIKGVASEAEDVMEYFMWDQLHDKSSALGPSRVKFEEHLKRVTDKIGSIAGIMPSRLASAPNAYSALVSLEQTTHLILNPQTYTISVYAKEKITSIREHVISLISLLENSPEKANPLEAKIKGVASEVEDVMEYFMWKQLHDKSYAFGPSRVEFEQQLKRMTEKIGSIAGILPSTPNMVYSALVSLTKTIDLILNPLIYSLSVVAQENIISILEYTKIFVSFLDDFPEKANRLVVVKDVAAEADDIIKNLMRRKNPESWWSDLQPSFQFGKQLKRVRFGKQLKRVQLRKRIQFGKKVKRVMFGKQIKRVKLKRVLFGKQLKRVRKEFASIGGDMMSDLLTDSHAAISSSKLASKGRDDVVVGLDEELIVIKGRLCGESYKLEVIPILGMGGIGKTTLARYAYDDRLTVEHFDLRYWVTISQDYRAQHILSCLRDSMKSFDTQMLAHEDEATMRERVYKCLKGRRYLIVMDDVWSTEAMDDMWKIFPDDHNGSRIMLTTRLSDVASYAVSDSHVVKMKVMDEDQCWNLLQQKVFTSVNGQGCPSELEDVGKDIARSCKGLPLAVVLIAGVLSKMAKTRASWEEIAKNVNSVVGGQLEKILSLSYTHLPHNLRSCFLYLGGFPEDHEVRVSELIKLWVAEGFLKRTNESKSLEEEAEEYLEDLVERSLVLVSCRKSNGKIKGCSLHDLVRDSCVRKAREEKFLAHAIDECEDVRRISIINHNIDYSFLDYSTIRTILMFLPVQFFSLEDFRGAKMLRVLKGLDIGLAFAEIVELFHLRCFMINDCHYFNFHVGKLVNLHTLIINRKTKPMNSSLILSLEIWEMPQLRHLVVYNLPEFPDFESSTRPLENLKTFLQISVSNRFLRLLPKMFPNVNKLGLLIQEVDALGVYLTHLRQLEKLKVIIKQFSRVGQNLCFPRTLKKLTLSGGAFPWKDMSVIGSLPNLQVLKLIDYACDGDTWETADGEFPQLQYLLIAKSKLRDWITECSHFPRLKCLILRLCLCLGEVPDSIAGIPSLELIEVDYRNKRLLRSAKEILEDQRDQGNDDLQVHINSSLHESFSVEKRSGKKCHMIGARDLEILGIDDQHQWEWEPHPESRFLEMAKLLGGTSKLHISVRRNIHNLSPNTTYAAHLVFKLYERHCGLESANAVVRFGSDEDAEETRIVVHLQKLADDDGGAQKQNGTHPVRRDDGWMEVEMGSFYTDDDNDDGEVEARLTEINNHFKAGLLIDGIEFRPKIQFDDLEDEHPSVVNQRPMDSPMCNVAGAKELTIEGGDNPAHWQWKACADSRFPEVVELNRICLLEISVRVKTHKLFSHTVYAAYLVYKLAEGCYGLDSVNAVISSIDLIGMSSIVHLKQLEQNGRHPVRRADGWMEVEMGSFYKHNFNAEVEAKLRGMDGETWKKGLIIESIEFRPKP